MYSITALETQGIVRRPTVPNHCTHNAHMYYLLLQNNQQRAIFIEQLKQKGINTVFHYVPLHTSPQGQKYAQSAQTLSNTITTSERIVRLPLWLGIDEQQSYIIKIINDIF